MADLSQGEQSLEDPAQHPSRMLGYLLSGSEAQRDRVADELDNDLIQVAAALEVRAGILARAAQLAGDPELIRGVEDVRASVRELRSGLRRAVLLLGAAHSAEGDLESALRDLAVRAGMGTTLELDVRLHFTDPLPSTISGVLYRVAQEAVSEALITEHVRHITIDVSVTEDDWVVKVESDGRVDEAPTAGSETLSKALRRLRDYIRGMNGAVVARDGAGGRRVIEAFIPVSPGGVPAWLDLAADAQLVLDSLSTGVLVVSKDWRVLFANVVAARLLTRTPAELEGQVLWSLCEDFRSAAFQELVIDSLDGQYSGNYTTPTDVLLGRVWFDPSPFGVLLTLDAAHER